MTSMNTSFEMALDAAVSRMGAAVLGTAAHSVPPVSDGEVRAAAARMRRCGYEHGERSLAALRSYLEGKPLMLSGTVGTGKTLFFDALSRSGVAAEPIVVYSLTEHDNDPMAEVVADMRALDGMEVLVDDVGAEHCKVEFGDRPEVFASIVGLREASARRTHFTTNLTAAELKERYGERVVSRLRRCEVVPFVGPDRRAPAANAADAQARRMRAEGWVLCRERCPRFDGGRCLDGVEEPPMARGRSPEVACGVGARIPYREEYLKGKGELDVLRERLRREYGL